MSGSAQELRSLAHGNQVPFAEIVKMRKDENATLSALTPDHISQLCKKAGGTDGGEIALEALTKLMDEHDW